MRLRNLLPLCALLLVGGCDNAESLLGEFRANVTGDVSSAFDGEAVYTTFDTANGPTFALFFFRDDLFENDREAYTYVALHRRGDRPGVGVFPVDSNDPAPSAFGGSYADLVEADTPEAIGPVLTATDGVLTITSFETGFMTGSFRFEGQGLFLPDRSEFIEAAVSGTFEARFAAASTLRSLGIDFDFD